MTSQGSLASGITPGDLARVSRTKVFFGHQSVGMNVLDGLAGVYAAHAMEAPAIGPVSAWPGPDGGFIGHAFIGENGEPAAKIQDFGDRLRSGIGQQADVAMMKLCYADITSGTNTGNLLATYRAAIAALEREFPDVTMVHVTVPLMTRPGRLPRLKSLLAGSSRSGPAANLIRERLNALIRREFAGKHLFDLAAVESTAPNGGRVTGRYHRQQCYELYDGYASDSGHLNAEGARATAIAWLKAVAQASPK